MTLHELAELLLDMDNVTIDGYHEIGKQLWDIKGGRPLTNISDGSKIVITDATQMCMF